jgi:hypothetical protein
VRQVVPHRIVLFDQANFPTPVPALDLLFTGNRVVDIVESLEPDQNVHVVSPGKPGYRFFFVLAGTPRQIIGYADIKRSVALAGERIDELGHVTNSLGPPSLAALARGSPGMTPILSPTIRKSGSR